MCQQHCNRYRAYLDAHSTQEVVRNWRDKPFAEQIIHSGHTNQGDVFSLRSEMIRKTTVDLPAE